VLSGRSPEGGAAAFAAGGQLGNAATPQLNGAISALLSVVMTTLTLGQRSVLSRGRHAGRRRVESMVNPAGPRPRAGFQRSQQAWALSGLAVLVLISVVAVSNLQSIYDAQKDFVVGSLLSLVGFCFGKAFSRTQEQKAIELIRTARGGAVEDALKEQISARLYRDGVFDELAVLARNVDAALERLGQYYDSQCRIPDFYRHAPLLEVALDDLDKTAVSVLRLQHRLGSGIQEKSYPVSPATRLTLVSVRRDLREAVGRRDQAYEWFATRLSREAEEQAWDMFAVMTSDMRKGERSLEALLSQHLLFPTDHYLRTTSGYLTAALQRAAEFTDMIKDKGVPKPMILEVMMGDLQKAVDVLNHVEVAAPDSVPAGVEATR
jgi:hypothetical protein